MGWVESPPYFYAASETARDVAVQYSTSKHPLGVGLNINSSPTHRQHKHMPTYPTKQKLKPPSSQTKTHHSITLSMSM
jgi:hypothetical protein